MTYYKLLTVLSFSALLVVAGCASLLDPAVSQDGESAAKAGGAPIFVDSPRVFGPDSAGGYTVRYVFKNLTDEDFKYVRIGSSFRNRVGDRVSCRTGFRGALRVTGPIEAGRSRSAQPQSKAYRCQVEKAVIETITITYMDDRTERFSRDELLTMNAVLPDN